MKSTFALPVIGVLLLGCGALPFDPSGDFVGTVQRPSTTFEGQRGFVRSSDGGELVEFSWPSQPCRFRFELEVFDQESITYRHVPTRCEWTGGGGVAQALETTNGSMAVTSRRPKRPPGELHSFHECDVMAL